MRKGYRLKLKTDESGRVVSSQLSQVERGPSTTRVVSPRLAPEVAKQIRRQQVYEYYGYRPLSSLPNKTASVGLELVRPNTPPVPRVKSRVVASQSTPSSDAVRRARALHGVSVRDVLKFGNLLATSAPTVEQARRAVICLGRKVRRELVFASGGAGQKRKVYKDRKSPTKVRC